MNWRAIGNAVVLLLVGCALGLSLAHALPHDWSRPAWERRHR